MPYTSVKRYPESYRKARDDESKIKPKLRHRIAHHIRKYNRFRKLKQENLPPWKEKWNNFNETKLGWLEKFVENVLPWLVIILAVILVGEFTVLLNDYGYNLIILNYPWTEIVVPFFNSNSVAIELIDQIIVSFFAIDLYFNFFRKRTLGEFLKSSFIDILAIAPVGLLLDLARIGEAQTALHVAEETEKEAAKLEAEAVELARLERISRILKAIEKLPKVLRLNKIKEFFEKD